MDFTFPFYIRCQCCCDCACRHGNDGVMQRATLRYDSRRFTPHCTGQKLNAADYRLHFWPKGNTTAGAEGNVMLTEVQSISPLPDIRESIFVLLHHCQKCLFHQMAQKQTLGLFAKSCKISSLNSLPAS